MKKWLKRIGIILAGLAAVWFVLSFFPISAGQEHAYISENDKTAVIAHRGGAELAPEGTLEAFRKSEELGVDILEYDVHLTADDELVVLHDDTVDRTTDGSGKVNEMTLEEVQSLDAGYDFQDENGAYSYRNQGVYIPTVAEVFEEFGHMRHLVELKDTNDPERYDTLVQEMWNLIEEYDLHDQVMIASFNHDINEAFSEISNGTVAIGAGEEEAVKFVLPLKLFSNALYNPSADAFQLPPDFEGIDLADPDLLQGAEERGVRIAYWTINDETTMRHLLELGAHGIMTDNPKLLIDVMNDMASG